MNPDGAPSSLRALLRPFPHRDFRTLWVSQIASELGDWAGRISLAVLMFETTGSAALTAAVTAVSLAPQVGPGQLLTVRLNAVPRRRVLVGCDLARAALFAAMALRPPAAILLVLAFLAGTLSSPFNAIRAAVLPGSVPVDAYPDALRVSNLTTELALVAGYLLGGAVSASFGPTAGLLIDTATFLVSAAMLARLPRPRATAAPRPSVQVRQAFRSALSDPLIRTFVVMYSVVSGCALTGEALAPAYVAEDLKRSVTMVGYLSAAVSVGAIIATVLLPAQHTDRRRVRQSCLLAFGGSLLAALALTVDPGPVAAAAGYLALGVAFTSRVPGNTVVGQRIDDELRAPVFSILVGMIGLGQAAIPLGAGIVASLTSPRAALVASFSVGCIAAVVGAVALRQLPHGEAAAGGA